MNTVHVALALNDSARRAVSSRPEIDGVEAFGEPAIDFGEHSFWVKPARFCRNLARAVGHARTSLQVRVLWVLTDESLFIQRFLVEGNRAPFPDKRWSFWR
jgi:hypothetical protein